MSSKQLARTVVDGRILTFTPVSGAPVTGYLAGMDDYHWLVVTPYDEQVLVHKSASKIDIGAKTYNQETLRADLERVIAPFRAHIQESGLVPMRSLSAVSATEGHTA